MKRMLLLVSMIIALTLVLGFNGRQVRAQEQTQPQEPIRAQTTPLTDEQIDRIKSNCTLIKGTLNQLHASDALLRVNRGQVYESVSSKLMDPFNARLSNNRLDSKAPSAVTDSFRTALATFRTHYREYELKLSSAIRIDCIAEPAAFHATIQEARVLRAVVHDDVLKLHRYIDDYRTAVGDFLLNYERVSE